ncbi:MAG: ABZJ_00895 family protein [Pseudomonadota bacterium]|uniref:Uncharacterized protein n=1 Tax=Gallaecimonas pentaromativorans TaxID=584787 RepID=A0A3N1PA11_9GAMM|nr:ABZJ_00895 family protein [Gallaecimonas pentaromativorans]MED5523667.1 ABZJ_00895 family protein [Pseudomonadota bacterium]ROQ24869.1 hypothetical protein EDC28_106116 [Gallaecimonas pentaromativorans]
MTLTGLFVRFTLYYLGLLALFVVAAVVFGFKGGFSLGIIVQLLATLAAGRQFCRANGRYFQGRERPAVALGTVVIALALQFPGSWLHIQSGALALSAVMAGLAVSLALSLVTATVALFLLKGRRARLDA